MSFEADVVIIGGGVVGLAVACHAAREGRSVYILEKNEGFGRETSSRNSGTIHTGILSPRGSINTALCFEGAQILYHFCREHSIDHSRTGKLLAACGEAESEALEILYQRRDEGIEMQRLSRREIQRLEPDIQAMDGVLLPQAGVIDAYGLMRCFLGLACMKGAQMVCSAEVTGLERLGEGFNVFIRDRTGSSSLRSRTVINCAGLNSAKVAALAGIDIDKEGCRLTFFKGEYYSLSSSAAARMRRRLVYPLLDAGGLVGIHNVLDTDGRVRIGPDFYPVAETDYSINDSRKYLFLEKAQKLFPFIKAEDIEPESCGIMPRPYGLNEEFRGFVIRHEKDRGLPGFFNVLGIQSPGLTASPAIGKLVAGLLAECL